MNIIGFQPDDTPSFVKVRMIYYLLEPHKTERWLIDPEDVPGKTVDATMELCKNNPRPGETEVKSLRSRVKDGSISKTGADAGAGAATIAGDLVLSHVNDQRLR